jgi:hypothetical protein
VLTFSPSFFLLSGAKKKCLCSLVCQSDTSEEKKATTKEEK